MQMNKAVVITQPDYDYTTRYISAWAGKIIDLCRKKKIQTITLKGKRSNRHEFESVVKKVNPRFIFLNGHGNEIAVAGQDGEILVQLNINESTLRSRIIYALSCRSAKILGKEGISKGVETYIGYKEDFIFSYDENELPLLAPWYPPRRIGGSASLLIIRFIPASPAGGHG